MSTYQKIFFLTYVVGTQKNPLNETVHLSTKTYMIKLTGKEISTKVVCIGQYIFLIAPKCCGHG